MNRYDSDGATLCNPVPSRDPKGFYNHMISIRFFKGLGERSPRCAETSRKVGTQGQSL